MFVYGWQRTVKAETGSEYAYLFAPVKNAESITAGKTDPSELGIKAVSEYELEITLEKATPILIIYSLSHLSSRKNQGIVEEKGDQYATTSDNFCVQWPICFDRI